jgi:hypothetical protein
VRQAPTSQTGSRSELHSVTIAQVEVGTATPRIAVAALEVVGSSRDDWVNARRLSPEFHIPFQFSIVGLENLGAYYRLNHVECAIPQGYAARVGPSEENPRGVEWKTSADKLQVSRRHACATKPVHLRTTKDEIRT